VLTIIGDIGDPKYESALRRFSNDRDPQVADAARSALRVPSSIRKEVILQNRAGDFSISDSARLILSLSPHVSKTFLWRCH
jgi:hypothetical protein